LFFAGLLINIVESQNHKKCGNAPTATDPLKLPTSRIPVW